MPLPLPAHPQIFQLVGAKPPDSPNYSPMPRVFQEHIDNPGKGSRRHLHMQSTFYLTPVHGSLAPQQKTNIRAKQRPKNKHYLKSVSPFSDGLICPLYSRRHKKLGVVNPVHHPVDCFFEPLQFRVTLVAFHDSRISSDDPV